MEIRSPRTKEEFAQYYNLRWRILRAPWVHSKEPELDELDENPDVVHMAAIDKGKVIGVGRGQMNSPDEGQVRYMAVDESCRGKGAGGKILSVIEREMAKNGAKYAVLNARENAVNFYMKHGYKIIREGPLIFGCIKHKFMRKEL
ncbi:MAG: GNAT family N-acetyltransferase [Candidatus Thermoplasmatota archaeon]|nr:GNAT family N-acetyltransferase [Candidatus Thermoplasmatota archaeon]